MESGKQWKCGAGCNQRYYITTFKTYCPHLEEILKVKSKKRSPKIVFTDYLDGYEKVMIPHKTEEGRYDEICVLQERLEKFNLSKIEVAVVVGRLGHYKSYREIAQDIGYSTSWTFELFKKLVSKLKKEGFK